MADAPLDLGEIEESLRRALDEVSAAVKRQWDGHGAFRLTIPVDEAHDSDCLITNALLAANGVLAHLRAHRAALEDFIAAEERIARNSYTEFTRDRTPVFTDAIWRRADADHFERVDRARRALASVTDSTPTPPEARHG